MKFQRYAGIRLDAKGEFCTRCAWANFRAYLAAIAENTKFTPYNAVSVRCGGRR